MSNTPTISKCIHFSTGTWSFVWHGSHTVNVLINGAEVDCFTYYDEDGNPPTFRKVEDLIVDYLNFDINEGRSRIAGE